MVRSIRSSLVPLLLVAAGCGITPDQLPAQHQHHTTFRHPAAQKAEAPRPQRSSRFADIAQAKFFADNKPAVPASSAPTPAVSTEGDRAFGALQYKAVPPPTAQPEIQQVQAIGGALGGISSDYLSRPPVDDPRKLKKITEIEPYTSYEPNPLIRAEDPCQNLCPRPDGTPCKDVGDNAPQCPDEVVLSNEQYIPRHFDEFVFAWEAANVWHNPIYFEDVPLERYGHTYPCWIQSFASVGKFGVQLVGLPYQMGIDPPWKKIYPLGYYRPGECAPKLHYQIPWNTRAALIQAGVTTGMFYLLP